MSSFVRIELVGSNDLPQIEGLVRSEFAYLDLSRFPLDQKLKNPDFLFFKILLDQELAGFLEFEWLDSWLVRLNGLVILPRFRQKGFGTRLLEFGIATLKERGCDTVVLLVASNNLVAKKLYSDLGFLFDHVWPEHIQEKEVEYWKLDLAPKKFTGVS